MKTRILALFLLLLVNGLAKDVVAAGTTVNLAAFKVKAAAQLERLMGRADILSSEVMFIDGAGSTDLPPVTDYASFSYVVTPKPGFFPIEDLKLGYRLSLAGTEEVVLLLGRELAISLPGGVALLDNQASKEMIEELISKLKNISPTGKFQYLRLTGVIAFNVPPLKMVDCFKELKKASFVSSVELDSENYTSPFTFDHPVKVLDNGRIDADKYRTVTRNLKAQGLQFNTETTVPRDLR